MKAPPRPQRLRKLSDEEIELWTQVAATVTPRPESVLPARLTPPPTPKPQIEAAALPTPPAASAKSPAPPPFAPLERTLKRKLSRGRMTADAALDLHGFRQDEAYGALHAFLHRSQGEGARVVLVVTGKGSRGGDAFGNAGVLRRAVPMWLALPDFRSIVVGFEEAGRPHGGAGALYVRLRRRGTPR
jgi:DNA-nicking Smr family endonuclease